MRIDSHLNFCGFLFSNFLFFKLHISTCLPEILRSSSCVDIFQHLLYLQNFDCCVISVNCYPFFYPNYPIDQVASLEKAIYDISA